MYEPPQARAGNMRQQAGRRYPSAPIMCRRIHADDRTDHGDGPRTSAAGKKPVQPAPEPQVRPKVVPVLDFEKIAASATIEITPDGSVAGQGSPDNVPANTAMSSRRSPLRLCGSTGGARAPPVPHPSGTTVGYSPRVAKQAVRRHARDQAALPNPGRGPAHQRLPGPRGTQLFPGALSAGGTVGRG